MNHASPARPRALTIIVLLVALGVVKAVWTLATDPVSMERAFPGLTPTLWGAYLLVLAGTIVTIAGLWQMRRWAAPAIVIVGLAGFLVDHLAGAPDVHQAATVLSTVALLGACWPARRWFLGKR